MVQTGPRHSPQLHGQDKPIGRQAAFRRMHRDVTGIGACERLALTHRGDEDTRSVLIDGITREPPHGPQPFLAAVPPTQGTEIDLSALHGPSSSRVNVSASLSAKPAASSTCISR